MAARLDRQVADEVARRAARRLEILRAERPDLLARRLSALDPDTVSEILELTRLPAALADRESCTRHLGIEGVDYCTDRLVVADPRQGRTMVEPSDGPPLAQLDDDDLLAARRYVPETLPGNVLG